MAFSFNCRSLSMGPLTLLFSIMGDPYCSREKVTMNDEVGCRESSIFDGPSHVGVVCRELGAAMWYVCTYATLETEPLSTMVWVWQVVARACIGHGKTIRSSSSPVGRCEMGRKGAPPPSTLATSATATPMAHPSPRMEGRMEPGRYGGNPFVFNPRRTPVLPSRSPFPFLIPVPPSSRMGLRHNMLSHALYAPSVQARGSGRVGEPF